MSRASELREIAAELDAWEVKARALLDTKLTDAQKVERFNLFILPIAIEYLKSSLDGLSTGSAKQSMPDAILSAVFGYENLHTAFGNDRPHV